MANVMFYEKTGCAGNARQKALLIASGHHVEVRDLRTARWTAAALRPFFDAMPVKEWFNMSSPRIKSGEVKPAELTAEQALAMMIAEPLLIRRPLMQVNDRCSAGFDQAKVDAWIGLRLPANPVNDACFKEQSGLNGPTSCAPPSSSPMATPDNNDG